MPRLLRAACLVFGHRYTDQRRVDEDGVVSWRCRRCGHHRYTRPDRDPPITPTGDSGGAGL